MISLRVKLTVSRRGARSRSPLSFNSTLNVLPVLARIAVEESEAAGKDGGSTVPLLCGY
jgi:hypothetical protein